MIAAKKSKNRKSDIKITISINKTIYFSAGFIRKYNLKNKKYLKLGYDSKANQIGIAFYKNEKDECLICSINKIWSIKPLLNTFGLNILQLNGIYNSLQIIGPKRIDSFSKKTFLINIKDKKEIIK